MTKRRQSPHPYTGIYPTSIGWQVRLSYKAKQVNLGYFHEPEVAAWVSDFARYLVFGLNPATWYHNASPPNFPPQDTDRYPRCLIVKKLAESSLITVELLTQRLAEFDEAAAKIKKSI